MESCQLLILHGWGSSSKKWQKVKEFLEKEGVRVIVPDFPGFGENPPPQELWGSENYAEWVKRFIEKNNILGPFFLAGHSFGGGVAIKFGAKYPENIPGLILVSPPVIRIEQGLGMKLLLAVLKPFSSFLQKLSEGLPFKMGVSGFFRKAFYRFVLKKTDYLFVSGIMKEIFLKVVKEEFTGCLKGIKPKTLIIWGEKDDVIPVKTAYLMQEKIPECRLVIMPGVKHNPHRENPEELARHILTFLNEFSQASA